VGNNERWWVFAECVAARSIQSGLPDALEETLRAAGLLAPFGDAVSCNVGPAIEVQVIVSAESTVDAESGAVEALAAALRQRGADPDTYQLTARARPASDVIGRFPSIEQVWGPEGSGTDHGEEWARERSTDPPL
jgi:hypothetical protein